MWTKGGSKVRVLGQGGACNSVPNGPNDLKFCMQGAFVCYYWVLVQSSSCNLYKGQACSGLQMWLASIEVTWPWIDQNSIVTHKSPLHAKFHVIWSIGCWVTGTPLSENLDFAPPLKNFSELTITMVLDFALLFVFVLQKAWNICYNLNLWCMKI